MNPTLRNKLIGAIAGGSGAIVIASVMLGNADGLEGRRYYAYQDVVGVWTVCDGHTGTDIRRGHRYTDRECDNLLKADLRKVASAIDPLIKVRILILPAPRFTHSPTTLALELSPVPRC